MSGHVVDLVWQHFDEGGALLLLALALGDFCGDDEGTQIFPSVATLAAKTRQSERTVQRQLQRLEKTGWLVLVSAKKGKTKRYRIDPAFIALGGDKLSRRGGVKLSKRGDTAMSPELKELKPLEGKSSKKSGYPCAAQACDESAVVSIGRSWYCRQHDPMRSLFDQSVGSFPGLPQNGAEDREIALDREDRPK